MILSTLRVKSSYCRYYVRKAYDVNNISFTPRIIRKGNVTPELSVPEHIEKPIYYETRIVDSLHPIEVKTPEQIQGMRGSCLLARRTLELALSLVKPGATTDGIDRKVHEFIISNNAYPSPLRYNNYPKSICTSVNEVMVHGIPDDTVLHDGDVINIDVSVFFNGFHGDCSETVLVGGGETLDPSKRDRLKDLLHVAQECVNVGISVCGPNKSFDVVGKAINKYIKSKKLKYFIPEEFVGHGIGSYFHGFPQIIHTETNEMNETFTGLLKPSDPMRRMVPGMTFTIEPIVMTGARYWNKWKDDWTIVTRDRFTSATWEHTILITEEGVDVLTKNSNDHE
ncbi:methionine aminopeptidase, mitochondrial [Acrasis kona]|uniref:Methionine aminopeptidase n=1 Tax=Acrasis kona TaxID=1008807 RepID=A0AAW2ZJB2_9EUKA